MQPSLWDKIQTKWGMLTVKRSGILPVSAAIAGTGTSITPSPSDGDPQFLYPHPVFTLRGSVVDSSTIPAPTEQIKRILAPTKTNFHSTTSPTLPEPTERGKNRLVNARL